MKRLTIVMAEDWNIFSKYSYEYDILCKSYAMGRKVTIAYAGKDYIENPTTLYLEIPKTAFRSIIHTSVEFI